MFKNLENRLEAFRILSGVQWKRVGEERTVEQRKRKRGKNRGWWALPVIYITATQSSSCPHPHLLLLPVILILVLGFFVVEIEYGFDQYDPNNYPRVRWGGISVFHAARQCLSSPHGPQISFGARPSWDNRQGWPWGVCLHFWDCCSAPHPQPRSPCHAGPYPPPSCHLCCGQVLSSQPPWWRGWEALWARPCLQVLD